MLRILNSKTENAKTVPAPLPEYHTKLKLSATANQQPTPPQVKKLPLAQITKPQ